MKNDILQRMQRVMVDDRNAALERTPPIPCLGRRIESIDYGTDYDCDYEYAGHFGCEDCIVNGGRYDPRTGRRT